MSKQRLILTLRGWAFAALSISYRHSLQHFTAEPIDEICANQQDWSTLRVSLLRLKSTKNEENHFLKQASALSTAAVLAVFSWTNVEATFWPAKMLWHSSFILSIFGLVSSAQQRVLELIPTVLEDHVTETVRQRYISLVLDCPKTRAATFQEEKSRQLEEQRSDDRWTVSIWTFWILQTPMMLMSWSWVLFLLGYALYLLSPVVPKRVKKEPPLICLVPLLIGVVTVANYFLCSFLAYARTTNLRHRSVSLGDSTLQPTQIKHEATNPNLPLSQSHTSAAPPGEPVHDDSHEATTPVQGSVA